MTLGNRIGVTLNDSIAVDDLFTPAYGSFIIELADNAKLPAVSNLVEIGEIGTTTSEYAFKAAGETLDLDAVQEAWESGIESVFPYRSKGEDKARPSRPSTSTHRRRPCTRVLPLPSRTW